MIGSRTSEIFPERNALWKQIMLVALYPFSFPTESGGRGTDSFLYLIGNVFLLMPP